MNRTLVVYQSKYGSTKAIAQKLALILGPAVAITPSDFNAKYQAFNTVVIGSPIYNEELLTEIKVFIQTNLTWLKTKQIALFAVSLSPASEKSFSEMRELLGDNVVWLGTFGGLYDPSAIDEIDSRLMAQFSKITGISNTYKDYTNETLFAKKALEIKRLLKNTLSMPQDELKKLIEDFLLAHNTCTLCTGHDNEVRATPIEYTYYNEALYFLTEGGEKFAHILANPNVSVAVYDSYEGFQKLGGLQITGTAEIICEESDTYLKVITRKGLEPAKLKALPVALNMIRVRLTSCEVLSSKIAKDGYEAKQSFTFV